MRKLTFFVLIVLGLSSCKKYPDGPTISFRARSERVINNWMIEKVEVNSKESTPFYSKYTYAFNEDASFTQNNGYVPLNGTWALSSNDDSIIVKFNNNTQVLHRFKILKLKNNSMWLIEDQNTSSYEWHLKSK